MIKNRPTEELSLVNRHAILGRPKQLLKIVYSSKLSDVSIMSLN